MISIYNIKPKFQQLLKPILIELHARRVTANQITISSIILSFIIGVMFWFSNSNNYLFLALPIGLFIRMALKALDGMMSRTYNQQTKKGEILNEIGDVFSDLFIFIPLLIFEKENLFIIVGFLCLSIINEFTGILGKVVSGNRQYDGPMGKSDRAFAIGLYGLLSFFGVGFGQHSSWIFLVLNILILISTITRIKKTLK